jgi:hypothetical protein
MPARREAPPAEIRGLARRWTERKPQLHSKFPKHTTNKLKLTPPLKSSPRLFPVQFKIHSRVILETVSPYNLGNSLSDTQCVIRKRLHVDIPEGTIRSWIRAHKSLTTYARLRDPGIRLLDPEAIIRSYTMRHKQVYRFGLHRAKLELLLQIARHRHLASAKDYLETIGQDFPHDMFQATEHRSSKFPTRLWPPVVRKENYATRLAALVLPTAAENKKRHETLQRFMLVNDSATVAVEIPVYLTP